MEFSRQEYRSEWPFSPPGDLPDPGIEPRSPASQADSLPAEPPGSPCQRRRNKRCGLSLWVGKTPWRRAWKPTPVFLPGESHGQRSLAGYSPWGQKEPGMTEVAQHTRIHSELHSTTDSEQKMACSPPPTQCLSHRFAPWHSQTEPTVLPVDCQNKSAVGKKKNTMNYGK